ncbi:MAG: sulfite oxidase [Rubrobacteraceae bacterium]|nr:sulfite oxidase [Rubrobacteraceae bacterium]MCL6437406.1 sulfite oxidase [Rubrobacteraceae bacterium]
MDQSTASPEFTREEVRLALRNPGMPLEALRHPVTPIGMHYLLTHFDIPSIEAEGYELVVSGLVRHPLRLSLDEIKARPAVTMPVMMECAGNGRAHLSPRATSQPWHEEAVGCAEWTGTPLRPLLEEAGLLEDAVEIIFTGHDRGIQEGVEHDYARSLPLEDALSGDVILAYEMNGQLLPPQHGFPLRAVVPGWYGMASVKWLKSITAIGEPFEGFQQAVSYRYQNSAEEPGTPVTCKRPRALMVPPGIPDFLSRMRYLRTGRTLVEGRAWSGRDPVERIEFSSDGGRTWEEAELGAPPGRYAWRPWRFEWEVQEPGEYELCVRATDAAGRTQPTDGDEVWNHGGFGVNVCQRVAVMVRLQSPTVHTRNKSVTPDG